VRRRENHGSGVCGGERRYVSTVGPTMCFGGKKLTGRKESYGEPENQHRGQNVWRGKNTVECSANNARKKD